MSNYVEEVRDFDSDIKAKESLVEEAKQLKEAGETPETAKKIQSLKRQWKRLGYWESAYEDQLNDEFLANLDYFYEKRQENYNKNKEVKEDIVKRANDLLKATNLNVATKTLNDLFEEWKKSGSAGKETKLLWETTLTKEEVDKITNEEVLKVPVEIKEAEPEYIYVNVLFEHELLESQQLMEAEAVPMNKDRVYTYAILKLYYEYVTVNWQRW